MKFKKIIVLSMLAIGLLATTGCKKDDKKDDKKTEKPAEATIGDTESQSSLLGNWTFTEDDGTIETVNFRDISFTLSATHFKKYNIPKTKLVAEYKEKNVYANEYTVSHNKKSHGGYDSMAADFEEAGEQIVFTPTNQTAVSYFEDDVRCGQDKWVLNVSQTFLPKDCKGLGMPGNGNHKVIMNVYKDSFYIGFDDDDGQTVGKDGYPEKLELEFPMKRVKL